MQLGLKQLILTGNFAVFLIHSVLLKQMPTYGHFIPYGHFPIQYSLYGHFIPYGHFPLWTLFHMDILPYGQFADSPILLRIDLWPILHTSGQFLSSEFRGICQNLDELVRI